MGARAFLVVRPETETILEAEEVRGFREDPGASAVEAAAKRLGGQWTGKRFERSVQFDALATPR